MPRKGAARAARATRANKSNGAALSRALVGLDEQPETLVGYYRQMVLIRRFEERAGEMYTRARIGGYYHLNLGEEATIVGALEPLEAKDYEGPGTEPVDVTIEPGSTGRDMGAALYEAGVVASTAAFVRAFEANDNAGTIQAGTHTQTVRMKYADFARLVKPTVAFLAG